ncbi:MAG: nucleoside triphosphate pyrophosphatase [Gordonia sp. (in: high G+C Gram-positive bacteria)]|uniref:Maf family protein n=1 Tax=Gordonia sp. (in: high G+C Gram-positive bacteria) TaxID=84139 RepID=UPI0039E396FE
MTRVVLGSASPARRRILTAAGVAPLVLVSDVDEDALLDRLTGAAPEDVVVTLAQAKADAVLSRLLSDPQWRETAADALVLTCDSMLLFDGALAGKPHTADVAIERWKRMRGRSGHLLTGHTVTRLSDGAVTGAATGTVSTEIRFSDVSDAVIEAYAASGEPLEVAGAFTLDGLGGWLLDGIDGDPSSVIGISLPLVRRLADQVGVSVTDLWHGGGAA